MTDASLPLVPRLLRHLADLTRRDGVPRTLLAVCPNSTAIVEAAILAAKRWESPLLFTATLNQVDADGGYTGMTHADLAAHVRETARRVGFGGPLSLAVDHGGPWLKDRQISEGWPRDRAVRWVENALESALLAGFDLLHIDATVDLEADGPPPPDLVARRTVELVAHAEAFRRSHGLPAVAYEAGSEEVRGGLTQESAFREFLICLCRRLDEAGLTDIRPCFVVGQVGTDLHTTVFDERAARRLGAVAAEFGATLKGHYTDDVANPEAYPAAGMGGANVGPEFSMRETDGLLELEARERALGPDLPQGPSRMAEVLTGAVRDSGRWRKWLLPGERGGELEFLPEERRRWIIRTGSRYVMASSEVRAARERLYGNLTSAGIPAHDMVLDHIGRSLDRYFRAFHLASAGLVG